MRPQPYIGVTGFMDQADVREVLFVYPKDARHKLMVGVLMSNKTLAGEKNKYPNRYPDFKAVGEIFVDHPQTLNLIHYHTSNSNHAMVEEMFNAMGLAGPHCHGGGHVNMGGGHVASIPHVSGGGHMIGNYGGGKGEAFDDRFAYECLCELTRAVPNMGVGIAGGLSAESVDNIQGLLTTHPDISIDAEGRLRTQNDDLNVGAACHYVVAANRLFRQYPIAA